MPQNYNARLLARGHAARPAGATAPTTSRTSTQSPETNCAPACADCGQLACLCRPRFFAGQLLSERDLNRLDAYLRAKNKLHTLQLSGWGVVNGLDVRCEPCGTGVIVGKGYAISPCGDDIIVCGDTAVDVCALIQKCMPADTTCKPLQGTPAGGCDDLIEDWVLAIRYAETPASGVAALRIGASCSCGASAGSCSCAGRASTMACGCGAPSTGTTRCGCGARPATAAMPTTTTTTRPRGASAECEPTVICEGFAWDAFPAPRPPAEPRTALTGPLIDRLRCCLQPLIAALPAPPGEPNIESFNRNRAQWHLWCCQTRAALLAYFSAGPQSSCTLVERLMVWPCPDPASEAFGQNMVAALEVLTLLLLEAALACFCAALLPPAPCGTTDDRVPLAVVRVRKKDCRVLEVCNWTPLRKTVLSFPALEYWLSWIPLFGSLADIVHRLCCSTVTRDQTDTRLASGAEAARKAEAAQATQAWSQFTNPKDSAVLLANPAPSPQAASDSRTFTRLVTDSLARGTTPNDPAALVAGLFGLGISETLSAAERANLPHYLVLNAVLRPIATGALDQSVLGFLRGLLAGDTARAEASASSPGGETAALEARITALEDTIKRMQGAGGHP